MPEEHKNDKDTLDGEGVFKRQVIGVPPPEKQGFALYSSKKTIITNKRSMQ